MLIPSAVSLLWFAIFGGAAINLQRTGTDLAVAGHRGPAVRAAAARSAGQRAVACWRWCWSRSSSCPARTRPRWSWARCPSAGSIEPQRWVVIFWGVVMGAIAIIMLLVAPGDEALTGIQNITIIMAAPFALVMVLLCVALAKDLRNDPLVAPGPALGGRPSSRRWTTAPRPTATSSSSVKPHGHHRRSTRAQTALTRSPSHTAAPSDTARAPRPAAARTAPRCSRASIDAAPPSVSGESRSRRSRPSGRRHHLAGLLLDLGQVLGPAEALRVDLVDVLGARRPGGEPAASVTTLSPPSGAPLPGASVSRAVIGSPASSVAVTSSADSLPSFALASAVVATSVRA